MMTKAKTPKMQKSKIDALVAGMVEDAVSQEAVPAVEGTVVTVEQVSEHFPKSESVEVVSKPVAVKNAAKKEKVMSASKSKSGAKVAVKKAAVKKAVVGVGYREKGMLSFGRWYSLLVAVGAKNKVKLPKGAKQEAYAQAYKAGKSPKAVLGLA